MSDRQIVLVPFGPTRKVPKGHRWCFKCDGAGKDYLPNGKTKKCPVCNGKGHWNAEDIDRWHKENPSVCRRECGKVHRPLPASYFEPLKPLRKKDIELTDKFISLIKKIEKIQDDNRLKNNPVKREKMNSALIKQLGKIQKKRK
ncbi:MAG: hypothetical protein V1928_02875 [Parcubacteria group bacterium]